LITPSEYKTKQAQMRRQKQNQRKEKKESDSETNGSASQPEQEMPWVQVIVGNEIMYARQVYKAVGKPAFMEFRGDMEIFEEIYEKNDIMGENNDHAEVEADEKVDGKETEMEQQTAKKTKESPKKTKKSKSSSKRDEEAVSKSASSKKDDILAQLLQGNTPVVMALLLVAVALILNLLKK
jgi:hypothetical protein